MLPSEFINKWKYVAIWHHIRYGIPASITLSQGALESNWGKSKLSTDANNYFGIKAYSNPDNLPVYYATDDLKDEPFRKYRFPMESFKDHAKFLQTNSRYSNLFNYNDSTSWAKGLKKAGYATSPTYDNTLISIIDKHNLNRYDVYKKNVILFLLIAVTFAIIVVLLVRKYKK